MHIDGVALKIEFLFIRFDLLIEAGLDRQVFLDVLCDFYSPDFGETFRLGKAEVYAEDIGEAFRLLHKETYADVTGETF